MSGRLEGAAAITGAASGFGATAARRFAAEGAKVVLGDIQLDAGRRLPLKSAMRLSSRV